MIMAAAECVQESGTSLQSVVHVLLLLSDPHKIKRGFENCQRMYRKETR